MHPVWRITEITLHIFSYLKPGDLARLARTCKDISDAAIDRLWERLTTIEALLSSLPSHPHVDSLTIEQVERLDFYARRVKYVVLEKSRSDVDASPPQRYWTARTKRGDKLPTSGKPWNLSIEPWKELWARMAELRPVTSFLPNLQQLRVSNITAELLRPFVGIAGKNLTYVRIRYVRQRQHEDLVRTFLENLQDTSRLEYLCAWDALPDVVSTALIQRSPLKTLRLEPRVNSSSGGGDKTFVLPSSILLKSELESLTVGLTREWYGDEVRSLKTKYLPTLKHLWLDLRAFHAEYCPGDCTNGVLGWTCHREWHTDPPSSATHHTLTGRLLPDCGRRPPSQFIRGLDSPKLERLNIKFPIEADAVMVLDTMQALADSCQLQNLSEMVLSDGGGIVDYRLRPLPIRCAVRQPETWKLLDPLGSLPQLRVLQLPFVWDLLGGLDMVRYTMVASRIPAVQCLSIDHYCRDGERYRRDHRRSGFHLWHTSYRPVPLENVAAFCHLLPNLIDLELGCLLWPNSDTRLNPEWTCPGVRTLRVSRWIHNDGEEDDGHWRVLTKAREEIRNRRQLARIRALQTYFPNLDLTEWERVGY